MKNKYFFIPILMLFATSVFSQKIDKQELSFEYIQLPSKPLAKSIKNYSSQVILAYEAEIIAAKQNVQEKYDKAVAGYPQTVEAHREAHAEATANYEKDIADWKKRSLAEKIAENAIRNNTNKPVRPGSFYPPPPPTLKKVDHLKIYDTEMLANTYIKLAGYQNTPEQAISISVTLYGFESREPQLKKEAAEGKPTKYWYEVAYKHPASIKIETPDGKVLAAQKLSHLDKFTTFKTNYIDPSKFNTEVLVKDMEDKAVNASVKLASHYLNDVYGFPIKKRKATIFRIESKKLNYDDYQKAYEAVVSGYNLLATDEASASPKIKAAIEIWEKAFTSSSPSNKKARINAKISVVTLFNLTEAYIWTADFKKAEDRLNKITGLNPSKRQQKSIAAYRSLIKKQKAKWIANTDVK